MRFPPIGHEQWTDEVREILASFSVPFSQYGLGGDESEKDKLSPILSTVLQNPELARVYFPLADYILRKSSLQPRHTRIIILRVAWLWQFEVEWAIHASIAVRDGILRDEDVRRVVQGPADPAWSPLEKLIITSVDQMRESSNIDDTVWCALAVEFSNQQLADLTFTIGSYVLAGMYMNCFGLSVPAGLKGFESYSTE